MNHLRMIREAEIELATVLIPPGSRVLEIGAGAGWQARSLARRGLRVEAIDVAPVGDMDPGYDRYRVWPVMIYDGAQIPFPDAHFDVIYSSNVLEHIARLSTFHAEMMRVLQPDGLAIHIVPTGTWRFWSNITHYAPVLRRAAEVAKARMRPWRADNSAVSRQMESRAGSGDSSDRALDASRILRAALPPRHGEDGNALSEMWRFSRRHWDRLFLDAGWHITRHRTNRLYYTGSSVLGASLSLSARRRLSFLLGSSCHVYALRKADRRVATIAAA